MKFSVAHIKLKFLFLKWISWEFGKHSSFIRREDIYKWSEMPQSNLTHYQQHTINKQHTNGISAMESVSVEFRDPLECSLCGGTVSWLHCISTYTPHRGHGWNHALNKCSLNKQCFLFILSPNSDCPLFIFQLQSPINSTFLIKIPVSFPFCFVDIVKLILKLWKVKGAGYKERS